VRIIFEFFTVSYIVFLQLRLSEYDTVGMALSQLEDWQTAAVPLVTLIESLSRHRLDVVEAFLSSTEHGTTQLLFYRNYHSVNQSINNFVRIWQPTAGLTYIIQTLPD